MKLATKTKAALQKGGPAKGVFHGAHGTPSRSATDRTYMQSKGS